MNNYGVRNTQAVTFFLLYLTSLTLFFIGSLFFLRSRRGRLLLVSRAGSGLRRFQVRAWTAGRPFPRRRFTTCAGSTPSSISARAALIRGNPTLENLRGLGMRGEELHRRHAVDKGLAVGPAAYSVPCCWRICRTRPPAGVLGHPQHELPDCLLCSSLLLTGKVKQCPLPRQQAVPPAGKARCPVDADCSSRASARSRR